MNIIGVYGCCGWEQKTAWLHSSGASLFMDGVHKNSISEERLTRKKYEGNFPDLSVKYLLDENNISIDDIDIAVYVQSIHSFANKKKINTILTKKFPKAEIIKINHHLAHASAAYHSSGFDDATILSFDGAGNAYETRLKEGDGSFMEADTGFLGIGNKEIGIKILDHFKVIVGKENSIQDFSLGSLYNNLSRVAYMMITDSSEDSFELMETAPGKIMGLAAYSKRDLSEVFNNPIVIRKNSENFIKVGTDDSLFPPFEELNKYKPEDIARWCQKIFEDALVIYFRELKKYGILSKNLCISGGCGLNVICNKRLLDSGIFENIHVFPATNDSGLPFGAALYIANQREEKITLNTNLAETGKKYKIELDHTKEYDPDYIAQAISDGKVIGWFQGGSEYGPRALGFRSILADPRNKEIKKYINDEIKHREWWRPYAPVILEEELENWFDQDRASPYMLFSANVKNPELIPGVTHADNTARVQTVNSAQNPKLYELLKSFHKITGVPILLNTSFNVNEPIVETPLDAMKTFTNSKLDMLVLENHIIEK